MSKLQKIKKTTLSDQVCHIIKDRIKSNQWPEDSRIPSENELAESFGVNRLTVRNALQKLNAMGIVETRAGEGTFVRRFDFTEYIREVSDLVMSPEMLEGVMEFRKCIELECIKLSIQRTDTVDYSALEDAYARYESATSEHPDAPEKRTEGIIDADLNFHYNICSLSNNKLFEIAFDAVREPMYQYIKLVFHKRTAGYLSKLEEASVYATSDHRQLLNAIKEKDYVACEQIYINMIDFKIC